MEMRMTRPALPLPLVVKLLHLAAWLVRRQARPAPRGAAADSDTAWLNKAADLADLERRLKRLERGRPDRFGPLPP
ncbi:hypothetical protein CDO81_21075 [Roseateles puraquae]|uniref:DUF3563 domain-containing protein n=2 Tax=Roseateles puraquae TaxID=431059 RepID=A0A254N320_9BURK|nr:hypothetical protein CDO81_21075 [Roseateles puraquae]